MPSRIVARLLTGPFGFLVAGMIDLLAFIVASVLNRTRGRRKADPSSPRPFYHLPRWPG